CLLATCLTYSLFITSHTSFLSHPHLSFSTRRSSDLNISKAFFAVETDIASSPFTCEISRIRFSNRLAIRGVPLERLEISTAASRSEEHTSELQSRFELVCRLLLDINKLYMYTPINIV